MTNPQKWAFYPDEAVNISEIDPDGLYSYAAPIEYITYSDHIFAMTDAESAVREEIQQRYNQHVLDDNALLNEIRNEQFAKGFNLALDKALEAVEGLPHYSTQITVSRESALTAIDSLKRN